jgi:preprotein translocase subunit SecG
VILTYREESILKTALVIVFLVVSVVLAVIVMMQEGKGDGLTSTLSGSSDTYWSKNKGKSKEAILMKVTIVLGILYMLLALTLASKWV